jgi:transposase InsO family protein
LLLFDLPQDRQGCVGHQRHVLAGALEWVNWFNNRRLLEPIGNIPPAEAEAHFYAQIEELAMVA